MSNWFGAVRVFFKNIFRTLAEWLESDEGQKAQDKFMRVLLESFMETQAFVDLKEFAENREAKGLSSGEKYKELFDFVLIKIEAGELDQLLKQFSDNVKDGTVEAIAKWVANQVVASLKFDEIN